MEGLSQAEFDDYIQRNELYDGLRDNKGWIIVLTEGGIVTQLGNFLRVVYEQLTTDKDSFEDFEDIGKLITNSIDKSKFRSVRKSYTEDGEEEGLVNYCPGRGLTMYILFYFVICILLVRKTRKVESVNELSLCRKLPNGTVVPNSELEIWEQYGNIIENLEG